MKKGDKVDINIAYNYTGQDMDWTEITTETKLLKKGTKLAHRSSTKLTKFKEKITCFSQDVEVVTSGYNYICILKKDIVVDTYDDEVRININNDIVDIFYIGKTSIIVTDEKIEKRDRMGRIYYEPKKILKGKDKLFKIKL